MMTESSRVSRVSRQASTASAGPIGGRGAKNGIKKVSFVIIKSSRSLSHRIASLIKRSIRCMQECDCDCRIQDGPGQERIRQWLESAGNKRRRACVVLYFMISQTCTLTANFRFHSKKDGKCASAESAERNSFKSSVSHHNATNHRVAAADSTHG